MPGCLPELAVLYRATMALENVNHPHSAQVGVNNEGLTGPPSLVSQLLAFLLVALAEAIG